MPNCPIALPSELYAVTLSKCISRVSSVSAASASAGLINGNKFPKITTTTIVNNAFFVIARPLKKVVKNEKSLTRFLGEFFQRAWFYMNQPVKSQIATLSQAKIKTGK